MDITLKLTLTKSSNVGNLLKTDKLSLRQAIVFARLAYRTHCRRT